MKNTVKIHEVNPAHTNRRNFLKISGLTLAGTGLFLAGCSDDDDIMNPPATDNLPGVRDGKFDLGAGDFGVLTYAYALEQLEADFYEKVVNAAGFTSFPEEDQLILSDIYKHELIHKEFFKAALSGALPNPATQLLPDLAFNYGNLNFSDRNAVLATAKTLEDTGVAAYNGAGRLITNPDYLVLAGKIVSVEARHASAVRSLINPNSKDFAGDDIVNAMNGLDVQKKPSEIIAAAGGFITTEFTATFLP